ncbi:hypothetical protein EYZ11_000500 [Aspergillus tanneri]|uniref:Kynurenine formamidase n=1 Tax=Aspergillus tanneri TaxID=1220188 RepID=A0A4S3JX70_9EURO|nr:uncharacterized protein ATNIH1004_001044 [Aspergillus tanneri]KAA8652140.1 hypothetical protein ATNIH1004_001044 [Aspergillus tanneri]THD00048.1 hypothetical protein EYZ11_000500 [Aspergillus tanneri]
MLTETLHYGQDHVLQSVTITTLPQTRDTGYWVILIHGGAWRDPNQTATRYLSGAASILTTSPIYTSTTLPRIAAFASIDYRLSPHPNHPQDRSTTNPREFREAKHPDHIHDVQRALAFLQQKYGFGERYILVGHSCGATLAFQSVMGLFRSTDSGGLSSPSPTAILGMAGIYDIRLLRDTYQGISIYQQFLEEAFGSDESVWDAVSPALVEGPSGVEGGWNAGRLAVLAHSSEDRLVDLKQRDVMRQALASWEKGHPRKDSTRVEILSIKGDHNDSWEKGDELARAIAFTLGKLDDE